MHLVGSVSFGLACLAAFPSVAAETYRDVIEGPIEAHVVKVRDGDTVEVDAFVWPGQAVRVAVRLKGIDAPEHKGRCDRERRAARAATTRLVELIGSRPVRLTSITGGKYYGRVLADMAVQGAGDVGRILLGEGLVARYGGGARPDWCAGILSGSLKSFDGSHRREDDHG